MVHFPRLAGTAAGTTRDAGRIPPGRRGSGATWRCWQDAGVDALLFCNENDIPYPAHGGSRRSPAAMAAVIGELRPSSPGPVRGSTVLLGTRGPASPRSPGPPERSSIREGPDRRLRERHGPQSRALARWTWPAYREAIGASGRPPCFGNITPEFSSRSGHSHRRRARPRQRASFLGLDVILIQRPRGRRPVSS